MIIDFPIHSKLLTEYEIAINENKNLLFAGWDVKIKISPQKDNVKIRVNIDEANNTNFWVDWESAEPVRFPIPIRDAVWVLFRQGCYGDYQISLAAGLLSIRFLGREKPS